MMLRRAEASRRYGNYLPSLLSRTALIKSSFATLLLSLWLTSSSAVRSFSSSAFATSASSVLLTNLLIEIPYLRARSLNSLGTLAETTTDMGLPLTYYDISITEREFFLPCIGFIAPPPKADRLVGV